jgi:DNA-binding protein YbaB
MSRLEAVLNSIDAQADASLAKLSQAEEFAARSEALRVEGQSAGALVTVVVDVTGHPTSVTVDDRFTETSAAELGADVMEALRQAQRRLSFRIEELGTEIYGEASPTVQMFADQYRSNFGYEEMA